jgi:hypothetical protein
MSPTCGLRAALIRIRRATMTIEGWAV